MNAAKVERELSTNRQGEGSAHAAIERAIDFIMGISKNPNFVTKL